MKNNIIPGLNFAQDKFEKNFAEVIAVVKGGIGEVYSKLAAELHVHPESLADVNAAVATWSEKKSDGNLDHIFNVVDARFRNMCQLFCQLHERDAFEIVAWTQEANDAYLRMQEAAGFRQAAPPAPPPKTTQEILDDTVIADYATLSSDKFRRKVASDPNYRNAYNRLAETNRLASRVTQLHDVVGG